MVMMVVMMMTMMIVIMMKMMMLVMAASAVALPILAVPLLVRMKSSCRTNSSEEYCKTPLVGCCLCQ